MGFFEHKWLETPASIGVSQKIYSRFINIPLYRRKPEFSSIVLQKYWMGRDPGLCRDDGICCSVPELE